MGRWRNRAEEARSGCRLDNSAGNHPSREAGVRRALYTCRHRGRGVRLLGRSPAGIASAPAAAPPGGPLPPGLSSGGAGAPTAPTAPAQRRGGTERAAPDLTWGCTSPRHPAAPRSPSRAVPAPRRPKPLTPLPPPCPRRPARCQRAAAAWRRGSRGRTPGR